MDMASTLKHSLAEPFLRFNLLPSLLMHPDQARRLLPEALQGMLDLQGQARALHRHWSAALRRQMALGDVNSLDDPALALALLDAPRFERLLTGCGIAVLGPAIRRVIARDDVAAVHKQLGDEGLSLARRELAGWAGEGLAALHAAEVSAQASRWGGALLCAAFEAAAPEVGARARLRLAPDAHLARAELPAALARGPAALALARAVLDILEPAWLSSFPAHR